MFVHACSCRLRLACKAFWRDLDSTSAYWADVCIELPAVVDWWDRPSIHYLKQGLGSFARSVNISITEDPANEDQAELAEVQALDLLNHLGQHCQLQSLQLSGIYSSGIDLLNALVALTSLTRLALKDFRVTSGDVDSHIIEVQQLLQSPSFDQKPQWPRCTQQSVPHLTSWFSSVPELAG